jgi:hypothetical protein
MAVFALLSALMLYETHVESVTFYKMPEDEEEKGYVSVRRYRIISCFAKQSWYPLKNIVRVHAVKRGFIGKDADQSSYALVVTFRSGNGKKDGDTKLKILETKRQQKIIKEVSKRVS